MFFLFLSVFSLVSVLDGQTLGGPMHDRKVVCYVASWATYRKGLGQYTLEHLDPSMCTHIVYSFAGLDPDKNSIKSLACWDPMHDRKVVCYVASWATNRTGLGQYMQDHLDTSMCTLMSTRLLADRDKNSIKSLDPWQDLEKNDGMAGYKGLVSLKERYPHLKCTIAIGGWNEGSPKYSAMASQPETRKAFIQSVMTFLNHYNFDGLDLDWEYPTKREGKPEDRENFVILVKELNEAFQSRGYILTAALGAGKTTMDTAYDLAKLSRYLDLIHMMCYDYHGTWDGVVGTNAPLRSNDPNDFLTLEYTINYMIGHGVSPYKLVLGLPFYGRTFVLQDPNVRDVVFGRTPVKNKGFKGPYTGEDGFMGYNEICMEITNKTTKWTQHWDEVSATPYLRDGERVICYDNPRSIAIKVKMAIEKGLGGLMVWSIDTDDFLGHCTPEHDTYVDFSERLDQIIKDPVLDEALKTLKLPDDRRIDALGRGTSYVTSNGRLSLRLPETDKILNYKLLRTINDATHLAIQEKKILDEMARVTKQNEINPKEKEPNSASRVASGLLCLFLCLFVVRL